MVEIIIKNKVIAKGHISPSQAEKILAQRGYKFPTNNIYCGIK